MIGWNERLYGLQIESRGRRGGVGPRAPPAPYIGAIYLYTQSTMRAQAAARRAASAAAGRGPAEQAMCFIEKAQTNRL